MPGAEAARSALRSNAKHNANSRPHTPAVRPETQKTQEAKGPAGNRRAWFPPSRPRGRDECMGNKI